MKPELAVSTSAPNPKRDPLLALVVITSVLQAIPVHAAFLSPAAATEMSHFVVVPAAILIEAILLFRWKEVPFSQAIGKCAVANIASFAIAATVGAISVPILSSGLAHFWESFLDRGTAWASYLISEAVLEVLLVFLISWFLKVAIVGYLIRSVPRRYLQRLFGYTTGLENAAALTLGLYLLRS